MRNDEFETRLKSLSPVSGKLDAVTAAYVAGRCSGRRTINGWRSFAGVMAVLAIAPWMLPRQTVVNSPKYAIDAVVPVAAPVAAPGVVEVEAPSPGNMWQLRAAVLEKGLDGLPDTPIPPARAVRSFETY